MAITNFSWTKEELKFLDQLNTPLKIQQYLDSISYNATHETNSPRWVMRKKRAHCVEGALFAAACLENQDFRPMVVDMRAENDDDHVIAVYNIDGCWGAIAKSNFTVIRQREPVYKSVRELVMSYFDFYFNSLGEKTLRALFPASRPEAVRQAKLENDGSGSGIYQLLS